MHIDLETNIGTQTSFASRFCIVGAGVAGLVLAHRLACLGLRVNILEAGGFNVEERSQSLFEAEMADSLHAGSLYGRFRAFGGSLTRWGGQIISLNEDTFSRPDGCPAAAWPIKESALKQYYPEINRMLGVGERPFDDDRIPGARTFSSSLNIRLRFSKWIPFRRRNLANTLGQDCLNNPLITVFTHANVLELVGGNGNIKLLRACDYNGRVFSFYADQFIVAAGTIESCRLLLASPAVCNDHDQIGRYFHDHVGFFAATVPPNAHSHFCRHFGPFAVDGVIRTCRIEGTAAIRQSVPLSAAAFLTIDEPPGSGLFAIRELLRALQKGDLLHSLLVNIGSVLRGLSDIIRLAWFIKVLKRRAVGRDAVIRLKIDAEQPTVETNRIRLSEAVDAIGMRKAVVEWNIGTIERTACLEFAGTIKRDLDLAGFPPLDWAPDISDGRLPTLQDTFHPMGGLRMGAVPINSVVDSNLKVHGMRNLYVASCAVFPSGGTANPTFTLLALTLRLADHLIEAAKSRSFDNYCQIFDLSIREVEAREAISGNCPR
jgi:choline dehydrogenase-like flavoprotein